MKAIRVFAPGVVGLEAHLVEVEVFPAREPVHFQIIGLPDSAVRESSHRVLSALSACGLPFPHGPLLVNLAPASTRKQGAALDLAVALGVTAMKGTLPREVFTQTLVVGELALDGKVRPVRGAFLAGALAREKGLRSVVCALEMAREVHLASPSLKVMGVTSLEEAALVLLGTVPPRPIPPPSRASQRPSRPPDLADVRGQERAVRALVGAAAGGHHLLMAGPPGAGKTFLALRLPGILPPLEEKERIEVTRIRSAAGLPVDRLEEERPFRAPHHSISYAGLAGGGPEPRPGEVTLASGGVLFLDELPEFERRTLEVLRQPLEEGRVRLARAKGQWTFPARFLLVAAMNPCPCGFLGHPVRPCRCSPSQVARYQARVSGPLLDRMDIRVWVPAVEPEALLGGAAISPPGPGLSTQKAREQVMEARRRQAFRYRETPYRTNGEIPSSLLDRFSPLREGPRDVLVQAVRTLGLSARGLVRVRRVALTLADLEGKDRVEEPHILEALAFRGEGRFLERRAL